MKTYKTARGLKAAWVRALRSGKYKQTKHRLERNGEYCCLGVLCKVAGVPIMDGHGNMDGATSTKNLRDRLGLGDNNSNTLQAQLIALNDERGFRFARIATWIEKNVKVSP